MSCSNHNKNQYTVLPDFYRDFFIQIISQDIIQGRMTLYVDPNGQVSDGLLSQPDIHPIKKSQNHTL